MPSTINKGSLLSQVDSIINSLNLSTDETRRLALFYKSALNAGSNTIYSESNVAVQMVSRLANTTSTDSKELLMLATGAGQVTDDRVVTVANTTVLNALANVSTGTIYFVESDGYPYIRKSDNTWTPLSKAFKVYNAWAWGGNTQGQLGDGTTSSRLSPVSVVGGFTDWIGVSAGFSHVLALRANGTAWGWGNNDAGKIGDDTILAKSSPVSVVGGFTDWISVQAAGLHSIGLRANGTLWAWGNNNSGRLADGTTSNRSSPVSVVGGFTDWTLVRAGPNSSVALRANGVLYAWGVNTNGQLGDNSTSNRSSPVSVVGGFTDWIDVGIGARKLNTSNGQVIGLRSNGTLWGWGTNTYGEIGDGTTSSYSSPVSVVGGFTDWVSVGGLGGTHSVAIRANGTLWAWGRNNSGQLGDGTTSNRSSPVSVVGGFTDWSFVHTGPRHTIAVRANGTLWGWGHSTTVGDGTASARSSPVSVVGGFTDWTVCTAGDYFSLALRA